MDEPRWMAEAWCMLGKKEKRGRANNEDIVRLFEEVGHLDVTADEVPWRPAFVGACLKRAGVEGKGSLRARSFLFWGTAIATPGWARSPY
jgi:hypothetical protein